MNFTTERKRAACRILSTGSPHVTPVRRGMNAGGAQSFLNFAMFALESDRALWAFELKLSVSSRVEQPAAVDCVSANIPQNTWQD